MIVPQALPVHVFPLTDHATPALVGSLICAWNCCVFPGARLAVFGETTTVAAAGAVTVTRADALLFASALAFAVTVTVAGFGAGAGAV